MSDSKCTCREDYSVEGDDLAAVARDAYKDWYLSRDGGTDTDESYVGRAILGHFDLDALREEAERGAPVAEAKRKSAASAWDEGFAYGHSFAMSQTSGEPDSEEAKHNPYREGAR